MQRLNYPALLSFFCGFSSLSLEILWVRLYSFSKMSTPAAFGFVLMAYLLGIAIGAYAGSRQCRRKPLDSTLWQASLLALMLSALCSLLLPAAFAWLTRQSVSSPAADILCIAASSSVLAFVFPIAHHLGTTSHAQNQGQRFALVYTANVAGAALGPLVTGYLLLDWLSLQQCFIALALLQLLATLVFLLWRADIPRRKNITLACLLSTSVLLPTWWGFSPHTLVQQVAQHPGTASHIIENRHGIITLYPDRGDDIVYGGNVYDGRTNLDPERNTNGLHRPLLLAALHPEPRKVLMIGLSIGSWLALVNGFPGVESVDVVEINPGYVQAAQAYPAQARALQDPRVKIITGDGRRWLRMHPETTYDLIIMNTTWHWRANNSLLLSEEFMQLLRQHMQPASVLAFNATGSGDVFFTASTVFAHTYRYDNFVYASQQDFRSLKSHAATQDTYAQLKVDGHPLFTSSSKTIERFLQIPFITIEQAQQAADRPFEKVTDQNMIPEFRYGRHLY